MQVLWFPAFNNVINYQFPNSRAELQQRFAKYEGMVVQIADLDLVGAKDQVPDRAYKDMLFGNMYAVAGVPSTTAYSGIGFNKFDGLLCTKYQGSIWCPEAWDRLWKRPAGYSVPLVDLMRASTIVVQNKLLDLRGEEAPDGWRRATEDEDSGLATVWERAPPPPPPGSRLSDASGDTTVTADRMTNSTDEDVTFRRDDASGTARLTFARLAWPGYVATLDGRTLKTHSGPAGLLQVDLPSGVRSGEVDLTFTPPGQTASIASYGVGVLLTIGLGVVPWFRRRRDQPSSAEPVDNTDDRTQELPQVPDNTPAPVGSGSGTEGGVQR
jgi:hypothetical protein